MNNPWLGWALALAALVAGYVSYGWRGVVLAITVVSFWLLLQFSRAVRVLRIAALSPVGEVANAVMLHARLRAGLRLPDVLRLTRSLGRKLPDAPGQSADEETWAWTDAAGDAVHVTLHQGRVQSWQLLRAADAAGAQPAATATD